MFNRDRRTQAVNMWCLSQLTWTNLVLFLELKGSFSKHTLHVNNIIFLLFVCFRIRGPKIRLLRKLNGQSKVWNYFGFRPNPKEGMENQPISTDVATCSICAKDSNYTGRSSCRHCLSSLPMPSFSIVYITE